MPRFLARFFHLPIFQFDRRIASENIHGDFQLATIRFDFFNHTAEIEERTIVDSLMSPARLQN